MLAHRGEKDDPLPSNHLTKRDRAALQRLLKNFSEPDLIALIAQERSRIDFAAKPDRGAPKSPKAQRPLLVALYVARCCLASTTIRRAAQEIYDTVEITIIRPKKEGLPTIRSIKSVKALEEDLRVGLKSNDLQSLAIMMHGLVFWRLRHVNPRWGVTFGASVKQTVAIVPKKPTRLIHWIDALIAKFPLFISSPLPPRKLVTE
jgi:hypothetical protein